MTRVFIAACGCVDEEGFGSARSWTPWPPSAGSRRLRWRTLSPRPFDRFGRLDVLCKHAVAAVEMLGLPGLDEGATRPDTALVLGSEHGSLDVDVRFWRSIGEPGGASPKLFSYTLPSTALGEIAIRHRITGPNLCLAAGPDSGLLALWEGAQLVASGEVPRCLCIACDALSAPLAVPPHARGYAFLLATDPREPALAEVAILTVEESAPRAARSQDAADHPLRRLFRFLSRDGGGSGVALYLDAPAMLKSSQTLAVRRLSRRPNGRAR